MNINYVVTVFTMIVFCTSVSASEVSVVRLINLDTGALVESYKPQESDKLTEKTKEIGGLSAIFMTSSNEFVALSDARSRPSKGLTRFYKGSFTDNYNQFEIDKVVVLKDVEGKHFGANEKDPESMVLLPSGNILWGSEANHSLIVSDLNGNYVRDLSSLLPTYFKGDNKTVGLRKNQSLEGMSLSPDGTVLFVAIESALIQDGSVSTPEKPSLSRILKFEVDKTSQLKLVGEFSYIIDRINVQSKYGVHDNGISDILAVDNNRLLIVERNGYSVKEGYCCFDFDVRVFKVDFSKATDISGTHSVNDVDAPNPIIPAEKKLYFKFSELVSEQQNYEGLTYGPVVDGKPTLLFSADNNFQPHQNSQIVLISAPDLER
ncbi:esterase-like activity of phytase family protein [Vibrio splendidus]|uniref:esterase-like activity of phytase family protein n=1 Tax=Vibrio splendidus TaxID=29497 RepID=UPI0011B79F96|nr:esterase-like activity of phytase family protein [Vibrio splendidus]